jgi:hypothetical protein
MIKVIGPKDKHVGSYINTTSRAGDWQQGLSPFFLGPVTLYNGYVAKNVENAWQFAKVYQNHVDSNGDPTPQYFKWAQNGWNSSYAYRYPMGKGAIPQYSYWDGQKLSYIEARKKIYIPIYAKAVYNTSAFQQLKAEYLKNGTITLWDFDGYDYLSLGMTLGQVINNPYRKMGHAFVLAMLLSGKLIVVNNQIKII